MINLLFHYIGNQLDSEAHLNWETNTMIILYQRSSQKSYLDALGMKLLWYSTLFPRMLLAVNTISGLGIHYRFPLLYI